jgi:hypothetical protein
VLLDALRGVFASLRWISCEKEKPPALPAGTLLGSEPPPDVSRAICF